MIWSGRFIAVIQPEFPSLEDLIFSCINPKGNKSHLDALAASASLNKCSLWCVEILTSFMEANMLFLPV